MKKFLTTALIGICTSISAQNLLVNGGFESPSVGAADRLPFTSIPGWTTGNLDGLSPYGIDLVSARMWQPRSGAQSLDLVSDNCRPGNFLRQDVGTCSGQQYRLSFWYANNTSANSATGHLAVLNGPALILNQVLTHSGSIPSSMGWQFFTVDFTAPSSTTTIMLVHDGADSPTPGNTGLAIDDVSLVVIPEPTTGSFLGLSALALCALRRKKRLGLN